MKWITLSHWRLLSAGCEQPQCGDMCECFYAFKGDKKIVVLFLCISKTLKPYGKKWLKPLFHLFQDLVTTYARKNNCVEPRRSQQQVPGVWVGHAALDKACHQFYLLIPCVQACGRSVFQTAFTSHLAIPYILQSKDNYAYLVVLFFNCQCADSTAWEPCCRVTSLWWHNSDEKFKSNRRNGIHLKDQQRTKLEPVWMMLMSVLTVSRKQEKYITFGKGWRYSFLRACKCKDSVNSMGRGVYSTPVSSTRRETKVQFLFHLPESLKAKSPFLDT